MINFEKIEKIYGKEMLKLIEDNSVNVSQNIKFFYNIGFDEPYDFFERIPYVFIENPNKLQVKISKLIERLGSDYIELIESDVSLLEELVW